MQLIEMNRSQNGVFETVTLDALWERAENLGKIEVDKCIGSPAYRVQIRFRNKNGSDIWAAGHDINIKTALSNAIQEAERLK